MIDKALSNPGAEQLRWLQKVEKKGSWPMGVTSVWGFHSTWTRPPNVLRQNLKFGHLPFTHLMNTVFPFLLLLGFVYIAFSK
jgi:hypothetical protein